MSLDISSMTSNEKIKAMELLWDDICRNVSSIESPPWHKTILEKREKMVLDGKGHFRDWGERKKAIRAFLE
ncbi:addiction module protein [bacterium]|nr:addiction module protein [candidate division CSSED10-310 bacterium]